MGRGGPQTAPALYCAFLIRVRIGGGEGTVNCGVKNLSVQPIDRSLTGYVAWPSSPLRPCLGDSPPPMPIEEREIISYNPLALLKKIMLMASHQHNYQ